MADTQSTSNPRVQYSYSCGMDQTKTLDRRPCSKAVLGGPILVGGWLPCLRGDRFGEQPPNQTFWQILRVAAARARPAALLGEDCMHHLIDACSGWRATIVSCAERTVLDLKLGHQALQPGHHERSPPRQGYCSLSLLVLGPLLPPPKDPDNAFRTSLFRNGARGGGAADKSCADLPPRMTDPVPMVR